MNFLKSYKQPIPSIYSTVLLELLVQQHLTRYKRTYQYDAIFALGFVTVYEQLMEGYPSSEDRDAIFRAYIEALNEDPEKYRSDARKLEEWARTQNSKSLVDFSSGEGEVEDILKDIAERTQGKGNFSYSRFFAIGLFRLLELANATEPTILEKLCTALNIHKPSVDRDLDIYRNLLSKLVQAKELLKEYVDSNHLKISIMSFSAEKRRRGKKGWDLRRLMKPLQSVPEIFYTQGISFGEVFMRYPDSACLMELQPSSISSLRRSGNCRVNSCYKSGYVSHCTILECEDPYTSQAFGFFLASCFILYFSINHL